MLGDCANRHRRIPSALAVSQTVQTQVRVMTRPDKYLPARHDRVNTNDGKVRQLPVRPAGSGDSLTAGVAEFPVVTRRGRPGSDGGSRNTRAAVSASEQQTVVPIMR